jgi:tRNA pseudouridine55 synthase
MDNSQLSKYEEGEVLLIDKPLNWTSFDVVNKIRYILKSKLKLKKLKVGHAGTLDPLATGLLILCTGKKTKEIDTFQAQEKVYSGTFYLGATTPSYDRETPVNATFDITNINAESIHEATKSFLGTIDQLPPIFSAIKKDGVKLYEKARMGEEVVVEPRRITILEFNITNIQLPLVDFYIKCSKGTYIRSLAFDYGKALNSGAYLYALRREKIGDFDISKSKTIDEIITELENL